MSGAPASAAPTAVQTAPYRFYALLLMLLVTVLNYVDRTVLAILQEPMKGDLGLSDWQLGLLSGPAFALFYSFSGVPVARFAERVNRARLLAGILALWSTMTALCGAATGFLQLAMFRIGVGAGEGGCIPITHSMIADYFRARQRGLVMSVVSASPSIAGVITPLIAAFVAQHYGWRTAFIAVGLPGLIVALLVFFTLREPRVAASPDAPPRETSTLSADGRWLFANRAFLYLFLSAAFIGTGNAGITAFKISFLVRTHDMSLSAAGGVYSLAASAGMLASFVGGFCADRFADERGRSYVLVPAFGAFLCFTCFLLAFMLDNAALVTALLILAAFGYNLKNGPLYAAVQNIVPARMRATAAAVYMIAATAIGGGIGPIFTGGISDAVAATRFVGVGSFGSSCPGGRAAKDAAASLVRACQDATAQGLQTALIATSFVFLCAGILLLLASRSIRMAEGSR